MASLYIAAGGTAREIDMSTPRPVVLITGGSRGIGAATARLAAARGYNICLNYLGDEAAATRVVEACRAAGATAHAVKGDMAVEADIARLFAESDARFGRLDALVNNAGITGKASRLDEAASEGIREVIDLNVTGAILVAREAVKRLSTRHGRPGGAIVNISSRAPAIGSPGEYVWYAASKGAIDAFTLGLARELATESVRVNAVAPGLIATDIHASGGQPDRLERLAPLIPMKRAGTAEEVAEVVLFLLSPAASYVTGTVVDIGGGR